uniref:Uncharacterized protein n=1 Tax=Romanomermis culicivorax TaxID=13658 RepID=A0A915JVQ6_ROMCU
MLGKKNRTTLANPTRNLSSMIEESHLRRTGLRKMATSSLLEVLFSHAEPKTRRDLSIGTKNFIYSKNTMSNPIGGYRGEKERKVREELKNQKRKKAAKDHAAAYAAPLQSFCQFLQQFLTIHADMENLK